MPQMPGHNLRGENFVVSSGYAGSPCRGFQMITITPIFVNFLATDTLKIDNTGLEKYCLDLKSRSTGRVISNGGGWQSGSLDHAAPELQELLDEVHKRLCEVHLHFNFNDTRHPAITESWINVNNHGHFNYAHNHPGSLFSCVYYVKGGANKGNIEFMTPIAEHRYTITDKIVDKLNAFTGTNVTLPPVTGELLIFPAWLFHQVRRNETDEDRISIAMNSTILSARAS